MCDILIWQITITVLSLFINNPHNIKDTSLTSDLFALFIYQFKGNTQ